MNTYSNDIYKRLTTWFLRKTSTSGVRRIAAFPAALSSDTGLVREENQDRVAIARGQDFEGQPYILTALCDGIGGMKDGAESAAGTLGSLFASFFETMQTDLSPQLCLLRAAEAANLSVNRRLVGKGGATLSALLVTKRDGVQLLNIGDSRIYRVDGSELTQLTIDDTLAGQLGHKIDTDIGNNLIQFIGIGNELEAKITQVDCGPDAKILLTSDGIHYLDPAWIGQLIDQADDLGLALRRVTETAKWCSGHDNASAAILLPSRAIEEPTAGLDSGMFEIWDSFGELQLHITKSASHPNSLNSRSQQRDEVIPIPQDPAAHQESGNEEVRQKSSGGKSKRYKRTRKQKARIEAYVDTTGTENKTKLPQLKIEFPKKAN